MDAADFFAITEDSVLALLILISNFQYYDSRFATHERGGGDFNDWVYEDDSCDEEGGENGEEEWEYWDDNMELSRPDFLKVDEGHEVINESEKILVFATGDIAHVPHQIGIKRMPEVRYYSRFILSSTPKNLFDKS